MMNTIEILETIGKDASLRHQSGERLTALLSEMDASDSLKQAALTRDHRNLVDEFGQKIVSMVMSHFQGVYDDGEEIEYTHPAI